MHAVGPWRLILYNISKLRTGSEVCYPRLLCSEHTQNCEPPVQFRSDQSRRHERYATVICERFFVFFLKFFFIAFLFFWFRAMD